MGGKVCSRKTVIRVFEIRYLTRMKRMLFLLVAVFISHIKTTKAQLNITLQSNLSYPENLSDIWGYTDTAGNEYALIGTRNGVSIVNVTDAQNPVEVLSLIHI